jgi:RNA polymerase sigma-70 factor (ECF subfamily)
MTDSQITDLLKSGHAEEAFREMVAAYSEPLYWHVRRLTNSHEDTDDLLQDIFVKIWTALPSFRGEAQLYTWLYRIALNEALNFLSRQRVRAVLQFKSLDEEMERRIDEDPYFNGDEAERTLSKAIARLPAKQKTVFLMRYYDDLPYEEIARITGTSVGSLKASYHIASEKIRKDLKNFTLDF